jgi:hypothetical protein
MNILESIHLKKVLVFDDNTFKITPGLTAFRGYNKDSTTEKRSANGTGKSLLFGCFANAILSAPPMAGKKNVNTFLPDKAVVTVNMNVQDTAIKIEQSATGKSVKYKIFENGKPKKTRTITEMRKAVAKIVPTSDAIFYSTVMVSSFRPPLLWLGTSTQRYDFFEDIAELQYYDIEAAKIAKKISSIKIQEKVIQPWFEELEDLKRIYTGPKQVKNLEKQIKIVHATRSTLRAKEKQISNLYNEFSTLSPGAFKLLEKPKFKTPQDALDFAKKAKSKMDAIKEQGLKLDRQLQTIMESRQQIKEYKKYQKSLAKLPEGDLNTVKKSIRKVEAKLIECAYSQTILTGLEDAFKIYKEHNLKKLKGKCPTPNKVKEQQELVERLEHEKELIKTLHKKGTCPICQSKPTKLRKVDSKTINHAKELLQIMHHLVIKYKVQAPEVAQAKVIVKDLKKHQISFDKLNALLKQLEHRKILLDNPIKKPKGKYKDQDIADIGDRLNILRAKWKVPADKFKSIEPDIKYYQEIDMRFGGDAILKGMHKQSQKISKKYESFKKELDRVDDEFISLQTQMQTIKQARKTHDALEVKYLESKKIIAQLPDWQALHKVFGPVGMRVEHMRSVVNSYVTYLNNMSPLIFNEPVNFSARLEGRSFDLLVTRHGHTSDVRYLSGAQSRFFIALSAVALRKMLPANKQFNVMILDEFDAGVSTAEFDKFSNQFLPFITEDIPSVIIITPRSTSEFPINNAVNYHFVRDKGKTTILTDKQMMKVA